MTQYIAAHWRLLRRRLDGLRRFRPLDVSLKLLNDIVIWDSVPTVVERFRSPAFGIQRSPPLRASRGNSPGVIHGQSLVDLKRPSSPATLHIRRQGEDVRINEAGLASPNLHVVPVLEGRDAELYVVHDRAQHEGIEGRHRLQEEPVHALGLHEPEQPLALILSQKLDSVAHDDTVLERRHGQKGHPSQELAVDTHYGGALKVGVRELDPLLPVVACLGRGPEHLAREVSCRAVLS
ncbi:hypothetical protein A1Q1_02784 [Trichosporon asahii var. asahii CBS 2479]|uniref:Uncharacterized protein n=1 Tax=Trichosporon asahii var. asahii (strain ATCC 90039 / CBS 2479 / JCM 2466 / KCTC 7840 / NBRC 103889/ NCYC 2677 / UAMH 7654) TaxID=1186058 RepID=J5QN42_TRIAS|nr:hypothetical protein A1Q1_02784 [Trichosporon asahii var. asahii CBS 2479]EJT48218.1 hypothetical protein A1Q1_02784 [Trichosporon asahii var. asahii CBS 2479]